jgi:hypothetical protein
VLRGDVPNSRRASEARAPSSSCATTPARRSAPSSRW